MFDLLEHPPASPESVRVGASVSVIAHAAVVVTLVLGTGGAVITNTPLGESMIETAIRYLLPPDSKGGPKSDETARWVAQGTGASHDIALEAANRVTPPKPKGVEAPRETENKAPIPLSEAAASQNAYTLLNVDSSAMRDPESAAPVYPPLLESMGIEGAAVVRFIVDTTGYADPQTYQLIETNHRLFGAAVRAALPGMKFRPASIGARKVRQLVELPFVFRIVRRSEVGASAAKKP